MARKQAELTGFERQVENPAIEAAAEAYCQVRDERSSLSQKEKLKRLELEAVMRAHNVERYEYLDDNGEILEAVIVIGESKAVVRKTGEAESDVGEGLPEHTGDEGAAPAGLMAQAAQAMADANVEESTDGDVLPIDRATTKTKSKKAK